MHLPAIIQDLAIILIAAGAMTLLFRSIRQPVVLGYIVAGFLVGPHFEWIPTILDTESIKVWADIGVIFLLFALGLEFSFKKLGRVGAPASITALVEVGIMIGIGFFVGRFFDWSHFDSLFLGGILAISSTTIIVRAFEELEMKTRGFIHLVFGVLIVEDLFAILLMVVLSTISLSQKFSGIEIGIAGLKLFFFLTLWFVLGIFLIPSFLKKVRRLLRPETLLIVSLGLCFVMVVLATKVGFSPALGAFIMGSILAETIENDRIQHLIQPIKHLFGAIFFVSVGMLIDPQILIQYALPIFVITLVTIVGKLVTTTAGSLLAGQSLRHSVQAGLSLAQIGEFSFIIAGLGLSLKVTSEFLYPIAISVSAITTFTTPYLIRSSDSVVHFLERQLPPKWIKALEIFRVPAGNGLSINYQQTRLKNSALKIIANAVVMISVFLIVSEFLTPWFVRKELNIEIAQALSLLIAFTGSAPFLWAITGGCIGGKAVGALWSERNFRGPLLALEMFRWSFAIILTLTLTSRIISSLIIIMAICIFMLAIVYLQPRYFEKIYQWLENRFVHNLNEKEINEKKKNLPVLAPWDSHLAEVQVSPESSLIGKKLSEVMVRERFEVTIALIQRGRKTITAPNRNDRLYPADILQIIGTDQQIDHFRQECETADIQNQEPSQLNYVLQSIYIDSSIPYANKTIRESGLREETHGLVVGIEKRGQRTLNPDSSTVIEPDDVLWIVGDQSLIKGLKT
ncbi:MAG: cation:proton antiporter [Bdellovibrionota bacterium]